MKKNLFLIVMMVLSSSVLFSQETWVKTFGGSYSESGLCIIKTYDGGYIVTGGTESNDGDFKGMFKGGFGQGIWGMGGDIFVIKLDEKGRIQWKNTYGGTGSEFGTSIINSIDSGFVITGTTNSNDGDFRGIGKWASDVFVLKIDGNGAIQWVKLFGGTGIDYCESITATLDSGYIITGSYESNDGDFKGTTKGQSDLFVMKLDRLGNIEWNRTFGGTKSDFSKAVISDSHNGILITGGTESLDGDFKRPYEEGTNIVVLSLDSIGNTRWIKTIGGTGWDVGNSIGLSSDGVIILTGISGSSDGDFSRVNSGERDLCVIRIDSVGKILTISTIGGSKDDVGNSISVSQCGNILVTGSTRSNDGDFEGMNKGDEDIVVASIDTTGVLLWRKTLGGSFSEWGNSITSSSDGGLLLTGVVLPYDGDFSKMYRGDLDVFVVKLDSNGTLNPNTSIGIESRHPSSLSVTPNPLSSVSTISYFLAQPTMVRIELVNSIGVVICVLSDKQEEEGPHYLSFNTTGLRTGAYSIRLIQTDRVVSKMVILTR